MKNVNIISKTADECDINLIEPTSTIQCLNVSVFTLKPRPRMIPDQEVEKVRPSEGDQRSFFNFLPATDCLGLSGENDYNEVIIIDINTTEDDGFNYITMDLGKKSVIEQCRSIDGKKEIGWMKSKTNAIM